MYFGLKKMAAFVWRDWKENTSYKFSFFLQFIGIFVSVTLFYFIAKIFNVAVVNYLTPYGNDYFAFVLIGIAFASYQGVGLTSFADSIRNAQVYGTLEALLVTPTSPHTIIIASSLWNFLFTSVRVLLYLVVGVTVFGLQLTHANYLAAFLILILTIVVFSALGILSASFIMVFKKGDPVAWLFGAASGLLGGVYFPITVLPPFLKKIALLLPITHSLEGMRQALLSGAGFGQLLTQIGILCLFAGILFPLSILMFAVAIKKAKFAGSLVQY